MVATQQQPGDKFAEYLKGRNLTPNAVSERTGIDRQVLARMKNNVRPRIDTLEELARFFGEDPNEWRATWGYPRADDRCQAALSGVETLTAGLLALQEEFGRPFPIPRAFQHVRTLTAEDATGIIAAVRRDLEEKVY